MQIGIVCHTLRSFCRCKFKGHWAMGPRSLCQQWTLQGAAHRHRYNPSLSCSSGHRSLHMEAVQSSGSEAKLLGFELQLCHSAPCATGDLPSPWHLTPSLVEKFCFALFCFFMIRNWVIPCEHFSEQRLSILALSLSWSLVFYFHKAEARVPCLSHCCYHVPVDMYSGFRHHRREWDGEGIW